jgi:hypothetical protein
MSESRDNAKAAESEDTADEAQNDTDKAGKFQTIKNPLTIIGAFAMIAEGAGAAVLPFIEKSLQSTYIWFLIGFPTLLVILFFVTLNFNNVKLYAPNDFDSDMAFITSNMLLEKLAKDVADAADEVDKLKEEIGKREAAGTQRLMRAQELTGMLKSADTNEFPKIQEVSGFQELLDTTDLAESKNKIDDIRKKLQETSDTASRYTKMAKDIRSLRKNPKQLLEYFIDSSLTGTGA